MPSAAGARAEIAARLVAEVSAVRRGRGEVVGVVGGGGPEGGAGDGVDDEGDDEGIPIDLNLGPEFAFTTIFSCPVSRDTGTRENPPMLLPCGHVFCRAAVSGISRGGPASRAFKCPLCPTEATPGSCRALVFPPFGSVSVGGGGGGGGGGEVEEEARDGKDDGDDDELMASE